MKNYVLAGVLALSLATTNPASALEFTKRDKITMAVVFTVVIIAVAAGVTVLVNNIMENNKTDAQLNTFLAVNMGIKPEDIDRGRRLASMPLEEAMKDPDNAIGSSAAAAAYLRMYTKMKQEHGSIAASSKVRGDLLVSADPKFVEAMREQLLKVSAKGSTRKLQPDQQQDSSPAVALITPPESAHPDDFAESLQTPAVAMPPAVGRDMREGIDGLDTSLEAGPAQQKAFAPTSAPVLEQAPAGQSPEFKADKETKAAATSDRKADHPLSPGPTSAAPVPQGVSAEPVGANTNSDLIGEEAGEGPTPSAPISAKVQNAFDVLQGADLQEADLRGEESSEKYRKKKVATHDSAAAGSAPSDELGGLPSGEAS